MIAHALFSSNSRALLSSSFDALASAFTLACSASLNALFASSRSCCSLSFSAVNRSFCYCSLPDSCWHFPASDSRVDEALSG
eukprot:1301159-Rhodomonas_salina.1